MSQTEATPGTGPESPLTRTCGCDCRRWAHKASMVCEQTTPHERLVRMYFDDASDPRGVYPRDVCPPCADHITFAQSRGGEHLAANPGERS